MGILLLHSLLLYKVQMLISQAYFRSASYVLNTASQYEGGLSSYSHWLMMRLVSMLCITQACHVTSFWAVIQISMSSRLIRCVFTRAKTALVAYHPPLSLAWRFDIWSTFLDLALHELPLKWDEMAFYLLSFTSCSVLKDTLICCLVYGLWLTGLCWVSASRVGFCPCTRASFWFSALQISPPAINLIFNLSAK